jgi:hypothetical protein
MISIIIIIISIVSLTLHVKQNQLKIIYYI